MRRATCISVFFLLALFSADLLASAKIEGLRLWRAPDHTRVVFDLDSPVTHQVLVLKNPDRLVLDIEADKSSADFSNVSFDGTPISGVRTGVRPNGLLRVVFDLNSPVKPRSFALKKIDDKPDRLVVDLYDSKIETVRQVQDLLPGIQNSKRDIVVAIDAGHGGEDPGAIGSGHVYEKDLVLLVAKNLANIVNAQEGYKAYLTRDGDYFITLSDRPEKARKQKADFFVSIHADGWRQHNAEGASVFILSQGAASSKMAKILASKENRSDLIGGADVIELADKEADVRHILVDLSMTRSLEVGLNVGNRVLRQLGMVTNLHSHRVEKAGFIVLKSPDVPSILVETGFVTNPSEARKLATLDYRTKIASAIFSGISSYFSEVPPEGTLVAWKKNGGKLHHRIARGDTLSSIASKYSVSVQDLKRENNLEDSTIFVGQVLDIPTI